uniref:Uncharacterized protein n=1 Tax=Romanomermis culicivorax TaxID=13658 RepID=A0A915I7S7_ROMCU
MGKKCKNVLDGCAADGSVEEQDMRDKKADAVELNKTDLGTTGNDTQEQQMTLEARTANTDLKMGQLTGEDKQLYQKPNLGGEEMEARNQSSPITDSLRQRYRLVVLAKQQAEAYVNSLAKEDKLRNL